MQTGCKIQQKGLTLVVCATTQAGSDFRHQVIFVRSTLLAGAPRSMRTSSITGMNHRSCRVVPMPVLYFLRNGLIGFRLIGFP